MQTDELELIARSLRQDTSAYAELVRRYKDAIYHHCFAIVRDEAIAEDIAQETFITAYYKLNSLDTSRRLSTWLFKIATNKALTQLKKASRELVVDEEVFDRMAATYGNPVVHTEHNELHDAVATLKPEYRAIISLYYWQGLDYEEIARVLGVPIGSVKGWMSRAKAELKRKLS